jgi:hypothetical protein
MVLCIAALLFLPAAARAQMQFRISAYDQISMSTDGTTIYGTSSFVDQSQGCGHSNYSAVGTVYTPDGREYPGPGGGLTSYVFAPTDGVGGTYTEAGVMTFHCSCVGNVEFGGSAAQCDAHLDRRRGPSIPRSVQREAQGTGDAASEGSGRATPRSSPRELRAVMIEVWSLLRVSLPVAARNTPNVPEQSGTGGNR